LNYEFPKAGKDLETIMEEIGSAEEMNLNFSSGNVFGSMCTRPLNIAKEVYTRFLESNLGNPGLYPGTVRLEKEVHEAIGSLIHAGDIESHSVGGGTEGNIMALWRAREKSGNKKVLLPKSAHFSFKKACSLLDMTEEYLPLTDRYQTDIGALEDKLDEETAAVVGIAGTTELGVIDPIEKMAEISGDIHFHVDAAFGGMVIPFMDEDMPSFDFQIQGVDTLIVDPHKMGMSPVPLGLFYSKSKDSISVDSPYLSGEKQKSLRGTRASASIPAFWATINLLGKEGYKDVIDECMENTSYLVSRMEEKGFELIIEPSMNIASFRCETPKNIVEDMKEKGWNISRTINPLGLRFVVMPHVSKQSIDEMVEVLDEIR